MCDGATEGARWRARVRRGDGGEGATEGVSERGMDRGWESEGGQGGLREIEGGVGASECGVAGDGERGRLGGRAYEERRWLFVCVGGCSWVCVCHCFPVKKFLCSPSVIIIALNSAELLYSPSTYLR